MRPEDIRDFLQRKPFQPFRLTLTDGRTYEVRHPEMAMVGRSSVAIGLPAPMRCERICSRASCAPSLRGTETRASPPPRSWFPRRERRQDGR